MPGNPDPLSSVRRRHYQTWSPGPRYPPSRSMRSPAHPLFSARTLRFAEPGDDDDHVPVVRRQRPLGPSSGPSGGDPQFNIDHPQPMSSTRKRPDSPIQSPESTDPPTQPTSRELLRSATTAQPHLTTVDPPPAVNIAQGPLSGSVHNDPQSRTPGDLDHPYSGPDPTSWSGDDHPSWLPGDPYHPYFCSDAISWTTRTDISELSMFSTETQSWPIPVNLSRIESMAPANRQLWMPNHPDPPSFAPVQSTLSTESPNWMEPDQRSEVEPVSWASPLSAGASWGSMTTSSSLPPFAPSSTIHISKLRTSKKYLDDALSHFDTNISPWKTPSEYIDAEVDYVSNIVHEIQDPTRRVEIVYAGFGQTMIYSVSRKCCNPLTSMIIWPIAASHCLHLDSFIAVLK
jgi:hypothetical protein